MGPAPATRPPRAHPTMESREAEAELTKDPRTARPKSLVTTPSQEMVALLTAAAWASSSEATWSADSTGARLGQVLGNQLPELLDRGLVRLGE